MKPIHPSLSFDVSTHESANTAVAASVISRIREDVIAYANHANTSKVPKIENLSDIDVKNYFEGDVSAEEILKSALLNVKELLKCLYDLRDCDARMLEDTIPLLEKAANFVDLDDDDESEKDKKVKFILKRLSGKLPVCWIEYVFGSLLSSRCEEDLLKLNPYISSDTLASLLDLVSSAMLRANRVGHINRSIGVAISLEELLVKILAIPIENRLEEGHAIIPQVIQVGEDLAKNITLSRHYVTKNASGFYELDPRYLVFEFVWNIQLRQKQIEVILFTPQIILLDWFLIDIFF